MPVTLHVAGTLTRRGQRCTRCPLVLVPPDDAASEMASNGGWTPGDTIAETHPHRRWGITRRLRVIRSAPASAVACSTG